MKRYQIVLFLALGLFLLFFSASRTWTLVKLNAGQGAEGEVVSVVESGGGRQAVSYMIGVVFQVEDKTYDFQQSVGKQSGRHIKQGSTVSVAYNPDDPSQAVLGKPGELDTTFYGGLAVFSILVSAGCAVALYKFG